MIEGCRRGDPAARRILYERYAPRMFGVLLRYVGARETAEDLLHDGFITLYTRIGDFRGEGSFEGWCRRIFVNTALGYLRHRDPLGGARPVEEMFALNSPDASALDRISAAELTECVGSLPVGYRTIFNLYAVEGFSHAEIGERLGISENTSRSQYQRARMKLMEMVKSKCRI